VSFDLQPTEEQTVLRDTLHDFATEVLRPAARSCEAAKKTSPEIATQIHEIGVTAPVAEAYGGGGMLDAVTYCMAAEELAWGNPGIAFQALGSGLSAVCIELAGTEAQKKRYLPRFAEAEPCPTFVATGEKLAAGDFEALETTVDGEVVVGEKYGVLNATNAAFGIVAGRTSTGLGAVIVEGDSFDVVKPEDKMGLEAAPTSVVRFEGVGEGLAGPELEPALLWTKLMTGAIAVGCARASFEHAAQYATEREAFGKPIGAFQAISFKVADMAIAVDAARLAVWHAAWALDHGQATQELVAAANGQALETAIRCGDDGVQVLGGHGYIKDHPVEMWFRDAVTLSVFDAPELLGDAIAARAEL
jgi:alkylation response protein AidB-like acyl-CoA dehydrogenase